MEEDESALLVYLLFSSWLRHTSYFLYLVDLKLLNQLVPKTTSQDLGMRSLDLTTTL